MVDRTADRSWIGVRSVLAAHPFEGHVDTAFSFVYGSDRLHV
jgi:hypothetical protein